MPFSCNDLYFLYRNVRAFSVDSALEPVRNASESFFPNAFGLFFHGMLSRLSIILRLVFDCVSEYTLGIGSGCGSGCGSGRSSGCGFGCGSGRGDVSGCYPDDASGRSISSPVHHASQSASSSSSGKGSVRKSGDPAAPARTAIWIVAHCKSIIDFIL